MSEHWYWQSARGLHGPITTEELDRLIQQNRIAETDRVGLAGTGEWLPAKQVIAMMRDGASATAASKLLSESSRRQVRRLEEAQPSGNRVTETFSWILSRFRSVFGWVSAGLGEGASRAMQLPRILRSRVALGLLLLTLAFIVIGELQVGRPNSHDIYDRISIVWEQLQSLEYSQRPREDRAKLREQTHLWLEPMLAEIEQSLSSAPIMHSGWIRSSNDDAELNRDLLGAGRSLLALLEDGEPNRQQQMLFQEHFNNASMILTESISVLPGPSLAGTKNPIATPAEAEEAKPQFEGWMVGVIALDVVIFCAIIYVLWRRRQSFAH